MFGAVAGYIGMAQAADAVRVLIGFSARLGEPPVGGRYLREEDLTGLNWRATQIASVCGSSASITCA